MGGLLAHILATGLSCAGGIAAVFLYPGQLTDNYPYYFIGTMLGGIIGYILGRIMDTDGAGPAESPVAIPLVLTLASMLVISEVIYLKGQVDPVALYGCVALQVILSAYAMKELSRQNFGDMTAIIFYPLVAVAIICLGAAFLFGISYYVTYMMFGVLSLLMVVTFSSIV